MLHHLSCAQGLGVGGGGHDLARVIQPVSTCRVLQASSLTRAQAEVRASSWTGVPKETINSGVTVVAAAGTIQPSIIIIG